MPIFRIATNVPRSDIPDGFLKRISVIMAKETGKPESFQSVRVVPDQVMIRGGTSAPCAECYYEAIGSISEQQNHHHTQALMQVIHEDLKIDKERMYIFFRDVPASDVGWNGTTFSAYLKASK